MGGAQYTNIHIQCESVANDEKRLCNCNTRTNRRNKIAKINPKCLKPTQLGRQIAFLWRTYYGSARQTLPSHSQSHVHTLIRMRMICSLTAGCVDSFPVAVRFEHGFVLCFCYNEIKGGSRRRRRQ